MKQVRELFKALAHPRRLAITLGLATTLAAGGALLGAGLAFRADNQLANPFLAIPGLVVFLYAIVAWYALVGTAVAAMAIAMFVRDASTMSAAQIAI